jgi:hypothetical protein
MNDRIKQTLGSVPYTAEIFGWLRRTGKPPVSGYSVQKLRANLPDWVAQAQELRRVSNGRQVFIFSMLPYWVEHASLLALTLAAYGYEVQFAYLPYAHWKRKVNHFDTRRQNLYIGDALKPLEKLMDLVPLLDIPGVRQIPDELASQLPAAAYRDVQYSLLREEVDEASDLFDLRRKRNETQTRILLNLFQTRSPEMVLVPNGSILEFGITFKVAEYLGIPTVSYEFGEQSERIWMAQNSDVMRQETDDLWNACKHLPLTENEWDRVRNLFSTRQGGGLWENFSRSWQATSSAGAEGAREALGLDNRPVVLLPTNVLGDSLTLGRQIFSSSMTEWLIKTIEYFWKRADIQFVIRVHPGEAGGWGPSVYDILKERFSHFPGNIRLLSADANVNTYDLVKTADLGLVFTTTVGMEMVMSGLPVIVTGQTHYRNKGFTLDPDSWETYFQLLDDVLRSPREFQPSREQVELAWTYAYRFFFDYPQPYPWHVQHFWSDVERWPIARVFSSQGQALFEDTFRYLTGEPIQWIKNGNH